MSGQTSIEWTDATWNVVTGCTKVSTGCKNCYAERVSLRTFANQTIVEDVGDDSSIVRKRIFTDVLIHPNRLEQPLHWRKPARIFVNSMSDLFHEEVPFEFIDQIFGVMAACTQHSFQILTKRPVRMKSYILYWLAQQDGRESPSGTVKPLHNVWLGVSCEDQKTADERIPLVLQTPAAIRFVSYEPALESVDFGCVPWPSGWRNKNDIISDGIDPLRFNRRHLDWIIVGGESGPGARPFNINWARSVIDQCKASGLACFMKQLGRNPYEAPPGITPSTSGPDSIKCRLWNLDIDKSHGGDWTEWPEDLKVRQYPDIKT